MPRQEGGAACGEIAKRAQRQDAAALDRAPIGGDCRQHLARAQTLCSMGFVIQHEVEICPRRLGEAGGRGQEPGAQAVGVGAGAPLTVPQSAGTLGGSQPTWEVCA